MVKKSKSNNKAVVIFDDYSVQTISFDYNPRNYTGLLPNAQENRATWYHKDECISEIVKLSKIILSKYPNSYLFSLGQSPAIFICFISLGK
jgi:hypothetical protein